MIWKEFLEGIDNYLMRGRFEWVAEEVILRYLRWYFGMLRLRSSTSEVLPELPEHIDNGFALLEQGKGASTAHFRQEVVTLLGSRYKLSQLAEVQGGVMQAATVQRLYDLFSRLTGDHRIACAIERYFTAQQTVLTQYFRRFLREVPKYILKRMATEQDSFEIVCGAVTVGFDKKPDIECVRFMRDGKVPDGEQLSFMRHRGNQFGLHEVGISLTNALAMIQEAITSWPSTARLASRRQTSRARREMV